MKVRLRRLARWFGIALIVAVALFQFAYRPWQRTWGAAPEEVTRAMPGDAFVPSPRWEATRAVGIQAPPEAVWPWLVQLGYRRAGFYSHDRLDNAGIPSARRIMPEYQNLKVGDDLPLSASAGMKVDRLEAPRTLVLVSPEGAEIRWSWAWSLYPDGQGGTRLICRLRLDDVGWRTRTMLDAAELIMMRKHLLGIKERAEAASRQPIPTSSSRRRSTGRSRPRTPPA